MAEIKHTFTYKVSPEKVYQALTEEKHLKQWWTPDVSIDLKVNGEARFDFKPHGDYCVMTITALEENKLVEWYCIAGQMMGTNEWATTTIHFNLTPDKEGTTLTFLHESWQEETPCFEKCTQGWKHFLGESLKEYLETGKGKPFKPEETANS